jgi:hypothetical protein
MSTDALEDPQKVALRKEGSVLALEGNSSIFPTIVHSSAHKGFEATREVNP